MKVVVIGAGVAGLATANRLKALGLDVQVLEANAYPGGKLTAFEQSGYRFDAGPSLFTMPDFLDDVFRFCKKDPRDYYTYQKLDVACHYFYDDGTFLCGYADASNFAYEVEKKLGVSKDLVVRYLNDSARLYETTGRIFLEQPLNRLATWLSKPVMKALTYIPRMGLFQTLNGFNEARLAHPKLIQLFNRYATYNGSDPYRAPGILSTIPNLEFNVGTFLPEGGMHAITNALVKLATDQGVTIQYHTPVEEILVKENQVYGVRTTDEIIQADLVVSNMDVYYTYRKLLPTQPAPERKLRQERSSSALIFYWGIKHTFPQLDLHNIFFSADYRKEFDTIFKEKTISEDPTVYINITSKYVKTDAPEGCENWFVMINVPPDEGQDWDSLISEARVNIKRKLSRMLNADVNSLIETESILDPRLIQSRTQSFQGSLYGTSSNSRYAAFLRHPNDSVIKNLYFCGGSVHPGGGIPLCLQSARIVANHIENTLR
ncbi:MAG: phytoene desaturase family protein [Cyclobacteriaceae bacterium]|nr:MAG: phytoene desaturase family protein [Cyclobacteriaceae bacterium]